MSSWVYGVKDWSKEECLKQLSSFWLWGGELELKQIVDVLNILNLNGVLDDKTTSRCIEFFHELREEHEDVEEEEELKEQSELKLE